MKHRWSTFLAPCTHEYRALYFPAIHPLLCRFPINSSSISFCMLAKPAHALIPRSVLAGCQSSWPTDRPTVTRRTSKLHQLKSCDRTTCTSGRKPQQLPCPSAASCWHPGTSSDNAVPATLLLNLWALRRRGKLRRRRLRLLVLGVSHSGLVGHWCGSERRVRRVRPGKSRHA